MTLRALLRTLAPAMLLAIAACTHREGSLKAPLLVFAAADLRDALTEAAKAFRGAGGDSVVLVFGSTGDLAAQIANGAPADVFFAANARAVDDLAAQHLVIDSTRAVYAIGRLAVIARCAESNPGAASTCPTLALTDLTGSAIKTVAIADPAHAPYGMAAKQALERAGVWAQVQPKLVLGANIAQAEQFVATGNADAGLIALSLVRRTPNRTYTLVDSTLHDPLRQTVVVRAGSTRVPAAIALVSFIQRGAGRAVLDRYGFTAPAPP
jgi:molybdate transport system substrate-binding protein